MAEAQRLLRVSGSILPHAGSLSASGFTQMAGEGAARASTAGCGEADIQSKSRAVWLSGVAGVLFIVETNTGERKNSADPDTVCCRTWQVRVYTLAKALLRVLPRRLLRSGWLGLALALRPALAALALRRADAHLVRVGVRVRVRVRVRVSARAGVRVRVRVRVGGPITLTRTLSGRCARRGRASRAAARRSSPG